MGCKRKPCKTKESNKIKNSGKKIKWKNYKGDGHGKFCYFISCPDSDFPIRDYVYEQKYEPHYEDKSYNVYAFCNQSGIRKLKEKGVSYIIFVTKYGGKIKEYCGDVVSPKFYITGLFPIYQYKKIPEKKLEGRREIHPNRVAYKSKNPLFLSIEDSIKLDNEKWKEWFPERDFPKNRNLKHPKAQLNYFTQFLKRDSSALTEIKTHFEKNRENNKINEYISEIKKYEKRKKNESNVTPSGHRQGH